MSDIRNLFLSEPKLYIAGIRTPFSSISITSAFNSVPSCAVTIPPDPRLYGIGREDRVPLLIFAIDPSTQEDILMFDGEIRAFSYASTALGKSLTVEAHGILSFMRDVQYRVLQSLNDFTAAGLPGQTNVAIEGSGTADFIWPLSLFMKGLAPIGNDENIIASPTEYLDNVVDILYNPSITKYTRSKVGAYYLAHSSNLNLPNRYTQVPYFDIIYGFDRGDLPWKDDAFPILAAVQKAVQVRALAEATKLFGDKQGSFYNMLNQVTQHMEYEVAMFAAPHYHVTTGDLVSMVMKPILYDANPPTCNIMYRPMVESIQTQEMTYGVPTRIRIDDIMGPLNSVTHGQNDMLTAFGTLSYYPSEKYSFENQPPSPGEGETLDLFAGEVLKSEEYTGPFQSEANAPIWMSYATDTEAKPEPGDEEAEVNPSNSGAKLKEQILAHMLFLARNKARSLSVTMAFNPYITPGFPGVVYDADGTGFNFVGHVVSVQHNLSKSGLSTSVQMSYVRTLEEEATGLRLFNSYPAISEKVTHKNEKMTEIYNRILGCDAIKYETLFDLDNTNDPTLPQDPLTALQNCYRTVATRAQYVSFMQQVKHQTTIPSDSTTETVVIDDVAGANLDYIASKDEFTGYYVENRRDTTLRDILRTVARESLDNTIYYR